MANTSLCYLFLIATLVTPAAVHAKEFYLDANKKWAAFRVSNGLLQGESQEYVYDAFGDYTGIPGYKISQLDWKIDSALVGSLGASLSPSSWLRFNGDYWHNLQEGEGTMDDYDWLYIGLDWSHHSHHENTAVTNISQWDVNAEWRLIDFDHHQPRLVALTGYRRSHFAWMSRGGTAVYSLSGYRDTLLTFYDIPVIAYEQTFSAPYIGLGLQTSSAAESFSTPTVSLNATLRYSNRVHAEDVDNHYLRALLIEQSGDNGKWYAADLNLDFGLSATTTLGIGASWQRYQEVKADKLYTQLGTGPLLYLPNPSGGLSHSSANFNVRFSYLF